MKKTVYLLYVLFIGLFSCSITADINDEMAVMKDIQGVWIGSQSIGKVYRHFKFSVANNLFEGWVQTSDVKNEPVWASVPDEKGFITLSSIIDDSEQKIKYRKFAFTCSDRCCGDKSSAVKAFTDLITYQEIKGLILDGKIKMMKK